MDRLPSREEAGNLQAEQVKSGSPRSPVPAAETIGGMRAAADRAGLQGNPA